MLLHKTMPDLSWARVWRQHRMMASVGGIPSNPLASNTKGAASPAFIQQKMQGTALISFTHRTLRHFIKPTELLPLCSIKLAPL